MSKRTYCATCAYFELGDIDGNGYCRHYDSVAHAENPTCENYKKAMKKKVDEIKAEMGFEENYPCCGNCKHIKNYISSRNNMKGGIICEIGLFYISPLNWCKRHERK